MPIIPNDTPIPTQTPYVPTAQDIVWNTFWANIGLISWIAGALAIVFFVIWIYKRRKAKSQLLFKDFSVSKVKMGFFRMIGGKYHEIERKRIKVTDQKFRYNNKDFSHFDIEKIAFSDKRSNIYAFDYDTGQQLTFNKNKMPKMVTIDDIDVYVNRGIVSDLVKGLEELKPKTPLLLVILALGAGVAFGIIIGIYAIPKPVETVYLNATQTPNPFLGVFKK